MQDMSPSPRGSASSMMSPCNKLGKKNCLAFDQLLDVSNLPEDGSIAPLDSHRAAMNKFKHRSKTTQVPSYIRTNSTPG